MSFKEGQIVRAETEPANPIWIKKGELYRIVKVYERTVDADGNDGVDIYPIKGHWPNGEKYSADVPIDFSAKYFKRL